MSGSPSGSWRARWAHDENVARGRAYASSIEQWQSIDDRLRGMRDLASRFAGAPPDVWTPAPAPGERVYLTLSGVWSVSAPHTDWLPPPAFDLVPLDDPAGSVPAGIRVGHRGTAVITSRRLIFVRPGQDREWAYERVTGLTHDPLAPVTLIQVSGHRQATGILTDPAAAETFRFHLQLALADAAGARPALVAVLDELLRENHQRRPVQPLAVEPIDAPLRARWSPLAIVAAVAVLLLIVLFGVGAVIANADTGARDASLGSGSGNSRVGNSGAGNAGSGNAGQGDAGGGLPAALGATPVASAAPASSARTPAPRAGAQQLTSRPTPPASTPPARCGAPANPLGYTFCAVGTLVTAPDRATCDYFACVGAFWAGVGYLVQCTDGRVSRSGGEPDSCARHGGQRGPVYRA